MGPVVLMDPLWCQATVGILLLSGMTVLPVQSTSCRRMSWCARSPVSSSSELLITPWGFSNETKSLKILRGNFAHQRIGVSVTHHQSSLILRHHVAQLALDGQEPA